MAGSSKTAVYSAIFANTAIAISKFIAAFFTGSSSMFSEGIHSLVDVFNGVLLIFGINRSTKKPDDKHPFGYGNEVYFWSFVVAILIFAVGGGFALYEGIEHLKHPRELANVKWNYVVLILAMAFEGYALSVALKQFNQTRGNKSIIKALRDSKDSSTSAVVIEDTAALVGLSIALLAVFLGQVTGNSIFDGLGSVLIGILLISVSLFFAVECKGLLIGEGLMQNDIDKINKILDDAPNITAYKRPLSLYFGPTDVLINLDVNFKDELNADEIEETIDLVESKIREAIPAVNRIFIEAETIRASRKNS